MKINIPKPIDYESEIYRKWEHTPQGYKTIALSCKGYVLDIGCGNGRATQLLTQANKVCAIDTSKMAIRLAKQNTNLKSVTFSLVHPYEDLGKNVYDTAVSFGTIEHIPDIRYFLWQVHRALKPQGLLIANIPTLPWWRFYEEKWGFSDDKLQTQWNLSVSSWTELLRDTGFTEIQWKNIHWKTVFCKKEGIRND